MDLANPISSIIPSGHGVVLAVLARTDQPMSGRKVAALTDGRLSAKGTSNVLRALADAGVVLVEDQPPSKLYRLNRRHLAARSIIELTQLRSRLLEAIRDQLGRWDPAAVAAWLFGSAARGDGTTDSDIDVLVVRSDDVDADDPAWLAQVDELVEDIRVWSGNACSVIEYSQSEFGHLMAGRDRLADGLRADGVRLAGRLQLREIRRRRAS